jgi:hypothetical protein
MKIKKESCTSDLKGLHCSVLWCSDGWRYNVDTFMRQRFFVQDGLHFEEERFEKKVFSDVQYQEYIELINISESPKIWIERGHTEEKFTQLDSTS